MPFDPLDPVRRLSEPSRGALDARRMRRLAEQAAGASPLARLGGGHSYASLIGEATAPALPPQLPPQIPALALPATTPFVGCRLTTSYSQVGQPFTATNGMEWLSVPQPVFFALSGFALPLPTGGGVSPVTDCYDASSFLAGASSSSLLTAPAAGTYALAVNLGFTGSYFENDGGHGGPQPFALAGELNLTLAPPAGGPPAPQPVPLAFASTASYGFTSNVAAVMLAGVTQLALAAGQQFGITFTLLYPPPLTGGLGSNYNPTLALTGGYLCAAQIG